jgi:vancomycin aglycone glucosyltransferase
MKLLLSSIGSRGDVQPILALALQLRALGHSPTLLVAPNFKAWVESWGIECVPIGLDVKQGARRIQQQKPTKAQRSALARQTVMSQFRTTTEAARGFDLILAGGALQMAGRSVAEALGIPYVYAAYCPATLGSPDHPPPKLRPRIRSQTLPRWANRVLWAADEQRWNRLFRETLNAQRASLNLAPIDNVARYVSTERPWLAADPILGPAGSRREFEITQTGAWLLEDSSALPDHLERFLADGSPPIYFGFGSMQGSPASVGVLIQAARAIGRRALISEGWAGLTLPDAPADCMVVGDVNHSKLFPRVAAVVHHGGAGTTTAAALAGIPQLIIPHIYDQYYWAHRIKVLGIGVSGHRTDLLSIETLVTLLRSCTAAELVEQARSLMQRVTRQGAHTAAVRLLDQLR